MDSVFNVLGANAGLGVGFGEIDIIGIRDNDFSFAGRKHDKGPEQYRTFVEGIFFGFGANRTREMEGKSERPIKDETTASTLISTYRSSRDYKTGKAEAEIRLGIACKVSVLVGVEFELSVSAPKPKSQSLGELINSGKDVPIPAHKAYEQQQKAIEELGEYLRDNKNK